MTSTVRGEAAMRFKSVVVSIGDSVICRVTVLTLCLSCCKHIVVASSIRLLGVSLHLVEMSSGVRSSSVI
jgi:hypothetical protein